MNSFVFNVSFVFLNLNALHRANVSVSLTRGRPILRFFSDFSPRDFRAAVAFLVVNDVLAVYIRDSTTIVTVAVVLYSANMLPVCRNVTLMVNRGVNAAMASGITTLATGARTQETTVTRVMFGVFNIL